MRAQSFQYSLVSELDEALASSLAWYFILYFSKESIPIYVADGKKLSVKYADRDNVFIYQESVANVFKILNNHDISKADYIISGIPFSSIPKNITEQILENTKKIMSNESMFITFQYSMFKIKTFQKHFKILRKKFTFFNVPSAYVICMKKKDNL